MANIKARDYTVAPSNRFVNAIRGMAEYEIRPGITVTLINEIDCSSIVAVRKSPDFGRPSITSFVAKALALTLVEFPYANRRLQRFMNCSLLPYRLQCFEKVDIMVAVEREIDDAPSAVFADVLRDADRLSLLEINAWLRELAQSTTETNKQWREFSWAIRTLPRFLYRIAFRLPYYHPRFWVKWRGGASMISSPAKYGVDALVGTWTAPLGVSFGLIKPRPIVKEDQVVVVPTMNLVLNFDRTVMAGAQAAKFFKAFSEKLENVEKYLL